MGQEKDRSPLLGLILLLAAALIGGYLWLDSKKAPVAQAPARVTNNVNDEANRRRLERVVNNHIQMTNTQIEVEKEQVKVEAGFTIPRVGEFAVQSAEGDRSFNLRSDRSEMNAARDLRRGQQVTTSASDIIQREMASQQAQSEYDKQYREEYARQFVENGRRNGYDIKLSEDYRVIGVKSLHEATYKGNGESFR